MTIQLNSLLNDPIFTVKTAEQGTQKLSLPEVCQALWQQEITSFEKLRTHQQQAWASFLSQLMTMALAQEHHTVEQAKNLDADTWKNLLLKLSAGEASAWKLVEDDVSKPAFLQSPIPEGSLDEAKYKDPYTTPDEMDMLVTSKNHDLKGSLMKRPEPEQWAYSLVILQTMEGFLGRGNYGIARMNGGFANRPKVSYYNNLDWSSRITRDVELLLLHRQDDSLILYKTRKYKLLWVAPWNGEEQISLYDCDPHFIEICRRIRLAHTPQQGGFLAWRSNTKGYRILVNKDLNGITQDPWTPVKRDKKGLKALTIDKKGYHYDLVRQLILPVEDYDSAYATRLTSSEKNAHKVYFVGEALARGQGITEGLHQRIVPVPAKRARLSRKVSSDAEAEEQRKLANIAKQRADLAGLVRSKVLYPSLGKLTDSGIDHWTGAYNAQVDGCFFEELFDAMQQDDIKTANLHWQETLYTLAKAQLEDAIEVLPLSSSRRWKMIAEATSLFEGSARKRLPDYFASKTITKTKEDVP